MAAISSPAPRLEVGQAVTATFAILRRDWFMFLAFAVPLGIGPQMLARVILALPSVQSVTQSSPATQFTVSFGISFLMTFAPSSILAGIIIERILTDARGQRSSFPQCLSVSLGRAPVLMGALFFQKLAVGIGLVILVVPGVLMSLAWAVLLPVIVAERASLLSCFRRSAELTSGVRGRIFGFSLAVGLIAVLLGVLAGFVIGFGMGLLHMVPPAGTLHGFLIGFYGAVGSTIASVIGIAGSAVLYMVLRREREGGAVGSLASVFD